jgi:hypothetical protein
LVISFIIIVSSGDKPAKGSYEYKGPQDRIEQKDKAPHTERK